MEYTFKLNDNHLAIINAGLQEIPFKFAVQVINEINKQIAEQQKPVEVEGVIMET